jgi:GNAT superfamily N-acetyltransferase
MMNYVIRPVQTHELAELLQLLQEHAAYERTGFSPEGKLERLSAAIFRQPARLFCEVVAYEQKIIGFVSYTFDFSTWDAAEFLYMDCLFLRENARGLGIGTAIMDKLVEIATRRGCINIQWQTPDFNLPAIRFYNRLGASQKTKARFCLDQ